MLTRAEVTTRLEWLRDTKSGASLPEWLDGDWSVGIAEVAGRALEIMDSMVKIAARQVMLDENVFDGLVDALGFYADRKDDGGELARDALDALDEFYEQHK